MKGSKKHILCFIASLSGGGAERQMIELIKILLEHGYRVTLLTYSGHDTYECPHEVERIHVVNTNKFFLSIQLFVNIKRSKCDCCISFLHQNNLISCLSTFPFKKFKLIVGERNFTLKISKLERILYYLYKRADYIVPNSESQSNFIKEHAKWLTNKIVTITNYTDINKNKQLFFEKCQKDCIYVGVFARYTRQKNPLFLVEVARELKKISFCKFHFFWFGNYLLNVNGVEQISPMYQQLQRKIQEYSLIDSFSLNSFSNDAVKKMNEMDVICLPSLTEGYPNAISEGMACGKFIVASNVSDIPYIVNEGVNGYLFDPNDVKSAVNAFVKYAKLPKVEIQRVCSANRAKSEQLFSVRNFAEKYISLIEK